MSGAFNYNQSKQKSESQSGLRGTPYEGMAESNAASAGTNLTNIANQATSDMTKYQGRTGAQMLPTGKYGMASNADPAMENYGKYMFGNASSSAGARGQLAPEQLGGIVGSAVMNSAPTLLPLIQQWQLDQFQAPVSLNQAAVQTAQAPAQNWANLLGAQASASGSSFGFGVSGSAKPIEPTSSDERLKQDIHPVAWKWKDNPDKEYLGVIAQELQQSHPHLVSTDTSGFLRVDYGALTAMLLNERQMLYAQLGAHKE
jgi:hypothetical protein